MQREGQLEPGCPFRQEHEVFLRREDRHAIWADERRGADGVLLGRSDPRPVSPEQGQRPCPVALSLRNVLLRCGRETSQTTQTPLPARRRIRLLPPKDIEHVANLLLSERRRLGEEPLGSYSARHIR